MSSINQETTPQHIGFPLDRVTREIDFDTSDGLRLHGWHLEAQGGPSKGNIVILHGFKDYSERYLDFAEKLSKAGFQVFAFDMRGMGRSEGERNYFGSIQDPVDDLRLALKEFKKFDNHQPWFVMGHSGGGSVVARYAIDYQDDIDGFILTAPLLKRMPEVNKIVIKALKLINTIAPHTGVVDLPDKNFSKDLSVVADMGEDPLINHGRVPARTGVEIFQNLDYIEANRGDIRIPFVVFHGEVDKVNNIEGSREFFEGTSDISGKHIKTYPNLFHDLLHEPEREMIEDDILRWVRETTERLFH